MVPAHLRRPLLKAIAAILLFGTVPAAIRSVALGSFSLGIVRLGAASAAMTAILAIRGDLSLRIVSHWPRSTWAAVVVIGLLFGVHWLLYFSSIKLAAASIGIIGFTTYGVQLPLLGWLLGFGRPRLRSIGALALALVGAALCLPRWNLGGDHTVGLIVAILSGTAYAALPLLHQHYSSISNAVRTWGQFTFGLPVFLLVLPWAQWPTLNMHWQSSQLWLILHLSLVVTLVGHFLWVQAATVLPITLTAMLSYLQLPVSLLFGWLTIGESLNGAMLLGAALVVAGNALALSDRPSPSE